MSSGAQVSRRFVRTMRPRRHDEEHRPATPLELFFDLCFVVAIAQGAASLHHAIAEDHVALALRSYPVVFFALWWGWVNFTWFASEFDTDDVPYRLATFVQIAGVLVVAAGVPRAFDDEDLTVVTFGYLIMRVALISQWLRAARSHPGSRKMANTYAAGIGICWLGWGGLLLLPDALRLPGAIIMIVAELSVPVIAERLAERSATAGWHPHHIAERYGLFTIIVLGESVLSATIAIQVALDEGEELATLAGIIGGGLLIMFSMWWLYFEVDAGPTLGRFSAYAIAWGYGHVFVFASGAAVGAGIAIAVDQATHHAEISSRVASLSVAIPVALFLASLAAVMWRAASARPAGSKAVLPVATAVVLIAGLAAAPVFVIGLIVVGTLALKIVFAPHAAHGHAHSHD